MDEAPSLLLLVHWQVVRSWLDATLLSSGTHTDVTSCLLIEISSEV